MTSKILTVLLVLLFNSGIKVYAQEVPTDSTTTRNLKFKYQALIIPSVLIGYGVAGLESKALQSYNSEVRDEISEHIDERMTLDDFTQYAPFLSVYGLNALGIKGKNNLRDRTLILATSYLIMGATVNGIKSMTTELRPDGSSANSFPSGHTATAFMGAEFLRQEYKQVSVWYGITGYAVAAGTGLFRVYNDRHWLTDVAAGAGIGILSTKIAYWVNPLMTKLLFKRQNNLSSGAIVYPYYNGEQAGVGFSLNF